MLLIVSLSIFLLALFAFFFHFLHIFKNQKITDRNIFIYSEGGTALFEAFMFFKVNRLKNNPRGVWLILESAWPLLMTLLLGILGLCIHSKAIENRELTVAILINNQTEGSADLSSQSKKTECNPLPSIPVDKDKNGASVEFGKRDIASDFTVSSATIDTKKGYPFFLMLWMVFITAVFTNYLVKSRFHADKWSLNNKALSEILNNKPAAYVDPRWKRFGHDLVITGMWGHRSFSKYFSEIVHANWAVKNPGSCFHGVISEHDCLRLLSEV